MATIRSLYPWVIGDAAVGQHTIGSPAIFGGNVQFQQGQYSFLPAITQPGTVASAGTVVNSTGADCMVYLYSSTGLSAVKVLAYNGANTTTYSLPGSIPANTMLPVLVPGPAAISVSYGAGTLSWTWVPK